MVSRTEVSAWCRAHSGAGVLLLSLLGLFSGQAAAQTVMGTVVEAETGAPLVTAYLTLTELDGGIVARTLSDAQGRFTLRAPAPGHYLVRVERLGRRTVVHDPGEVRDGEVVRVELRAESQAISLAGIEVTADQQCRLEPDEGVEMARVWEQARLALQVEALARTERIFRYQLSNYTRELAPDARRVLAQQSRSTGGYLDAPYVSAPVEELLAEGWVQEDPQDGGWTFFAPDAPVLLSDPFLGAHCFRLVADSDDSSLIGLAFAPTHRSTRPGIEGALWLDRESAELRHLSFRYTAFPGAAAGSPVPAQGHGGRVEFLELPGGLWVVNRWHIRMPVLEQVRGPRGTSIVLNGILEEGGEVTEIRRASGGVVARLGRGAVEGTVVNGRTGAPLAGARVHLQGTGYESRTGPRGSFRLEGLRPGTYTLSLDPSDVPGFLGALEPVQVAVGEDERRPGRASDPLRDHPGRGVLRVRPAELGERGWWPGSRRSRDGGGAGDVGRHRRSRGRTPGGIGRTQHHPDRELGDRKARVRHPGDPHLDHHPGVVRALRPPLGGLGCGSVRHFPVAGEE
jgi:hypothetical protein